jgi:serine/threonine protein kinase
VSFCEHGSLETFLTTPVTARPGQIELQLDHVMRMLLETARGMAHLVAQGFVHRDLAARNILLDSFYTCRVADFGLSRGTANGGDVGDGDECANVYYRSVHGMFPLRWTAPEAAEEARFSEASDVWSFAVVGVEILTDGADPYPDVPDRALLSRLSDGYRHPQPVKCSQALYQLLLRCWSAIPTDRPTFASLEQTLQARVYSVGYLGRSIQQMSAAGAVHAAGVEHSGGAFRKGGTSDGGSDASGQLLYSGYSSVQHPTSTDGGGSRCSTDSADCNLVLNPLRSLPALSPAEGPRFQSGTDSSANLAAHGEPFYQFGKNSSTDAIITIDYRSGADATATVAMAAGNTVENNLCTQMLTTSHNATMTTIAPVAATVGTPSTASASEILATNRGGATITASNRGGAAIAASTRGGAGDAALDRSGAATTALNKGEATGMIPQKGAVATNAGYATIGSSHKTYSNSGNSGAGGGSGSAQKGAVATNAGYATIGSSHKTYSNSGNSGADGSSGSAQKGAVATNAGYATIGSSHKTYSNSGNSGADGGSGLAVSGPGSEGSDLRSQARGSDGVFHNFLDSTRL